MGAGEKHVACGDSVPWRKCRVCNMKGSVPKEKMIFVLFDLFSLHMTLFSLFDFYKVIKRGLVGFLARQSILRFVDLEGGIRYFQIVMGGGY